MNWKNPRVFAIKHKKDEVRMNSRSGGFFTAISDYVIENDGIVYGCVLDENMQAIHIRANNKKDRNRMRESKYVQSNLKDCYKLIKHDLDNNKIVLFSGTSCQVDGLKSFLNKEYENLICCDIVCHGVPSPKILREYIEYQERKYKGKCIKFDFRNKKDFGWTGRVETLYIDNGKRINSKIFGDLFYGHHIIRPSCYKCPYKSLMHPGDFSLADYWGIDKILPDINDNKGISLIFINNDRALKIFNKINKELDYIETKTKDCMRTTYREPCKEPENREKFWKKYKDKGIKYIIKKYTSSNLKGKLKNLKRKLL